MKEIETILEYAPEEEFEEELARAKKCLLKLSNMCKEMRELESLMDLAVSDILHDIEISSLSAPELMQDIKLLQMLLKKRRRIKNCLGIESALRKNAHGVAGLANHVLKFERKYKARVLMNLKISKKAA